MSPTHAASATHHQTPPSSKSKAATASKTQNSISANALPTSTRYIFTDNMGLLVQFADGNRHNGQFGEAKFE